MNQETINMDLFSGTFQRAIKKSGISRESLAQSIGVSYTTVARLATAKKSTSIPTLISICNTLEITPDYLLSQYIKKAHNMTKAEYEKALMLLNQLDEADLKILHEIMVAMIKKRRTSQ
jgi:transcriptional regulator with XRE-family HTH domain